MASKYWIKLYHEILDDPKMGRLPDVLFRRTVEFFLMAGENCRDGGLPASADMAWRLRADEIALVAQMEDLEALNILSRDAQGGWRVTHFAKRQAPSPMSERVRRYRQEQRAAVFEANGDGNADVTIRYTDTDTDRDKEKDEDADDTPVRPPSARAMGDKKLEKSCSSFNPGDELVDTFISYTKIPLNTGGQEKWSNALERLKKAGVEKADLIKAIGECRNKGMILATLSSIVNPSIIAMSDRKTRITSSDKEDYRRYLHGEYGDFGSS